VYNVLHFILNQTIKKNLKMINDVVCSQCGLYYSNDKIMSQWMQNRNVNACL